MLGEPAQWVMVGGSPEARGDCRRSSQGLAQSQCRLWHRDLQRGCARRSIGAPVVIACFTRRHAAYFQEFTGQFSYCLTLLYITKTAAITRTVPLTSTQAEKQGQREPVVARRPGEDIFLGYALAARTHPAKKKRHFYRHLQ